MLKFYNLPLDGKAIFVENMAKSFLSYADNKEQVCPIKQSYKIVCHDEKTGVLASARTAALQTFSKPIVKLAFDTRRINQEKERNPRTNLQYWHRADEFIDADDDIKLRRFARLMTVLAAIKKEFDTAPEWFDSYSRVLYDTVHRILRIKQADLDIFKPQLSYLEQLVYARYQLSMDDLENLAPKDLRARILKKDEALVKRGQYLQETGIAETPKIIKNTDSGATQQSIINAIFGQDNLCKDGRRKVERTITIKISDEILE